ncbi:MAG: hypothetical protein DRJ03_01150 [Chloroflexi bacterium]|nr:MAG: hypothetical protein DRJ03_01150 [Chloroflexota bacterium]
MPKQYKKFLYRQAQKFKCKCGNRITSNHFPVDCIHCGIVYTHSKTMLKIIDAAASTKTISQFNDWINSHEGRAGKVIDYIICKAGFTRSDIWKALKGRI